MAQTKKKIAKKTTRKTQAARAPKRTALGPDVDVAEHSKLLVIDVAGMITLGRRVAPKVPSEPAAVARTGGRFVDAWSELDTRYKALPKAARQDVRPFDFALDNAWGALHGRITPWTRVPHPKAAQASELLALLFADGLEFTQLEYGSEWAESERRLTQIARPEIERLVIELAGADFLQILREAHSAYGDAQGITKEPTAPDEDDEASSLVLSLNRARTALAAYAVQLVAAHNASEDGAERKALRTLLAPIEAARRAARPTPKSATPEGGATPVTPSA